MNQHWAYGLSCTSELFKSFLWSCAAREAGLRQFSPVSLSCVCTNFLARWLDTVALVVLFVAVLRLSASNCEVQFTCCFTDHGRRVKREIPAAMQRVKLVFIQRTGASLQRQLNMSWAINTSAEVHLFTSELTPYQSHRFFPHKVLKSPRASPDSAAYWRLHWPTDQLLNSTKSKPQVN